MKRITIGGKPNAFMNGRPVNIVSNVAFNADEARFDLIWHRKAHYACLSMLERLDRGYAEYIYVSNLCELLWKLRILRES